MILSKNFRHFLLLNAFFLLFSQIQAQHQTPQLIDVLTGSDGSNPERFAVIGDKLIFYATTPLSGREPHISNGTVDGTFMVDDIYPGDSSNPFYFTELTRNGKTYAYYFANNGTLSSVLYRTDMSNGFTEFVARSNPNGGDGSQSLVKVNDTLFFAAQHPTGRNELFKNDGTTTSLVLDINTIPLPGGFTIPSNPKNLTAVGNKLFFSADAQFDGTSSVNRELWVRNGSDANTYEIEVNSSGNANPRNLVEKDGYCYFIADDETGTYLWRSNGSREQPERLDFPSNVVIDETQGLVNCGGVLFFAATDLSKGGGKELWTYGTGFRQFILHQGATGSDPANFTSVNGVCYFSANGKVMKDGKEMIIGVELWQSNGTDDGTFLIKDIKSGSFPSAPENLTAVRGIVNGSTKEILYFTAFTDEGRELWKSDGTEAGTKLVIDIQKGSPSSIIDSIVAVPVKPDKDGYFFTAVDSKNELGKELWYAAPCPTVVLTYGNGIICRNAGVIPPKLVDEDGNNVSGGVYKIDNSALAIDNEGRIKPDGDTPIAEYTITYTTTRNGCIIEAQTKVKVIDAGAKSDTLVSTLVGGGEFSFSTGNDAENALNATGGTVVSQDGQYLYVADEKHHVIKKIKLSDKTVSIVAGSSGVSGFVDGNGGAARFRSPAGLAIDITGTLYVADKDNHAIRKIVNPSGASPTVTTVAGNSNGDFSLAKGNATGAIAVAKFNEPSGIAVDFSGNIYVADKSNHRIKKITTTTVSTLAGAPNVLVFPDVANKYIDGVGNSARFHYPTDIALDLTGANLYVADRHNNVIRLVKTSDGTTSTFAGGVTIAGYKDGAAAAAMFHYPSGITVDAKGDVYVADIQNHVIRKISGGQVTTIASAVGNGAGLSDDVRAEEARFRYPSGIFADLEQNIYITDKGNQSIRKYYIKNPSGRITTGKAVCAGTGGTLEIQGMIATGAVAYWESSSDGISWTKIEKTDKVLTYSGLSTHTFYRAYVQNESCTAEPTNYAVLVIGGPIAPEITTKDVSRCGNGTITLTASGTTNGNYIWYDENDVEDKTQTGDTYTSGNLTAGNTYTFHVAVGGVSCPSAKVPVIVKVNNNPEEVITPKNPTTICPGKTGNYTVSSSGNTYKWKATNGEVIAGDGTNSVTVKWGTSGSGTIELTETTPEGCKVIKSHKVTISNSPAAPVAQNAARCGTGDIELTAVGATGGETYRWYDKDAKPLAGQTDKVTVNVNTSTTFYVSLHNGTCESKFDTITVEVFDGKPKNPVAQATPEIRCGNGDAIFTASGAAVVGEVYRWYANKTDLTPLKESKDAADNTFTVGVTGDKVYYVSIYNTVCTAESEQRVAVAIKVTDTGGNPPTAKDKSACEGKDIVLVAEKYGKSKIETGEEFRWYDAKTGGSLLRSTSGSFTIPSPSETNPYYVSFYNGSCETERVKVMATVIKLTPPSIDPATRCGQGEVTLVAHGADGGVYRWYLDNDTPISFKETDKLTLTLINTTDFYVSIVNGACESERTKVTATINNDKVTPLKPTVEVVPETRCGAGTFVFKASGAQGGQVYRFYLPDGVTIDKTSHDHSDNIYTTKSLSVTTAYYVTIYDPSCDTESTLAKVDATIGTGPNKPTDVTAVASRCGKGKITLSASGGGNGQYRWYKSETDPIGDALATTADYEPYLTETTTFYVSIYDGSCETGRVAITATVNPEPTAVFSGNGLACINTPITYTATTTGLTYTWTIVGGTKTAGGGISDNFVTVTWTTGTLGTITLEEKTGTCVAQTSKNITLSPKPTVPVVTGDIVSFCAYELGTNNEATYTIEAPDANYQYSWNILNGVVDGQIVYANGTDSTQVRIRWSNSLPFNNDGEVEVKFSVAAKAKDSGCSGDTHTETVTVKNTPVKPLLTDKVDSVYVNTVRTYKTTTNNIGAMHTYTWTANGGTIQSQTDNEVTIKWDNTAATRQVFVKETVTNTGCANFSDTATVYVFPYAVTAASPHPVICEGGQIKLKATDANAATFAWYTTATGGTKQYETSNNNTASDTLQVTQNTAGLFTYYVSPVTLSGVDGVNDSGGDNARVSVTFEVKTNDPANFTIAGDTTNAQHCTANGAGGGAITLTAVSGGFAGAPYTYLWTKNGDASYSAATKDIADLTPGTYVVQATDAGGCISNPVSFVIEDKRQYVTDAKITPASKGSLAINLARDTATISVGESIILTATATDAAAFAWVADTDADVANISDATVASPTMTPKQTTKYSVLLTNNKGCDTTISIVVRVLSFQVFVPNMFTPNNDNKNDRFQVFGNQVETIEIKVYNRAGTLVYEGSKQELMGSDEFGVKTGETQSNGWDGTYQQKPLPKGNYVWYLKGRYKNGIEINKSGNVLLLR